MTGRPVSEAEGYLIHVWIRQITSMMESSSNLGVKQPCALPESHELPGGISPVWLQDMDRTADRKMLAFLGRKTGASYERVAETTLHEFERLPLEKAAGVSWLLTRGPAFDRDRRFLRFCPACLREDRTVYFRRRWRLTWCALCEIHRLRLLDGCGACGRRLDLARTSGRAESLAACVFCGADLRQGTNSNPPSSPAVERVIGFEQRLLHLISTAGKEESPS